MAEKPAGDLTYAYYENVVHMPNISNNTLTSKQVYMLLPKMECDSKDQMNASLETHWNLRFIGKATVNRRTKCPHDHKHLYLNQTDSFTNHRL